MPKNWNKGKIGKLFSVLSPSILSLLSGENKKYRGSYPLNLLVWVKIIMKKNEIIFYLVLN